MNSFFNRGKRTCRTSQNPSLPSIESSYLRQSLRILSYYSFFLTWSGSLRGAPGPRGFCRRLFLHNNLLRQFWVQHDYYSVILGFDVDSYIPGSYEIMRGFKYVSPRLCGPACKPWVAYTY